MPVVFGKGDPMEGAFHSMLFFMGLHWAFTGYVLVLVYLAHVGL